MRLVGCGLSSSTVCTENIGDLGETLLDTLHSHMQLRRTGSDTTWAIAYLLALALHIALGIFVSVQVCSCACGGVALLGHVADAPLLCDVWLHPQAVHSVRSGCYVDRTAAAGRLGKFLLLNGFVDSLVNGPAGVYMGVGVCLFSVSPLDSLHS